MVFLSLPCNPSITQLGLVINQNTLFLKFIPDSQLEHLFHNVFLPYDPSSSHISNQGYEPLCNWLQGLLLPELNANIPPIEGYVRGNFLRNQLDSHDQFFPCVIFGVSSIQNRSPLFHFLMEDGGIWWRMPINAFSAKPDVAEEDIHNLVLWNSFSPYISVTKFANLANMKMTYIDRTKTKIAGKYLFTLDWHSPESNILDHGYSENPGQHKCGHVIEREDGNYAIQPNNRVLLHEPSFTTKDKMVIDRLINTYKWDVEDASKWVAEDSSRYHYDIEIPKIVK